MGAPNLFERLRDLLVRSSQIGKLKLDATFFRRKRDHLVQQLGEAALSLLEAGELPVHPGLVEPWNDIKALEQQADATRREIESIQRTGGAAEGPGGPGDPKPES